MKKIASLLSVSVLLIISSCNGTEKNQILTGADQPELYKPLLEDKAVGIVANQTSITGGIHLVDMLVNMGIDVQVIFAPEHGFRDLADAGESIEDGKDETTGITVTSLYGSHFKPTPEDLKDIDVVVFDIQDVGARFYTYISTLHYVMEACAENNVKCIVLDRPNPNGYYFDGNIADTARRSFVGMHPVPIVHGMTVGEYAGMVNGEGWLGEGIRCDLTVIKCRNYTHDSLYVLPVKPSPNLPNQTSIYLYPSICFFEGTNISLGRGTAFPFQVYGSPELPDKGFSFTPESVPGAKNPPLLGQKCFGKDLRNTIQDKIVPAPRLNLEWVIEAYRDYPDKEKFFTPYFDVLASGTTLREQIIQGMSGDEIRATWQEGLTAFGKIRDKYLLYD
ncbi:MAG: exo-beta-N-acetylmuramidase NamZ domain-containing protein [Bacteroidales bacterium]|jgi:uncharacterized protein YbbC (DUF1343 family)